MGSIAPKVLPGQLWLLGWRQLTEARPGRRKIGRATNKQEWLAFPLADRADGLESAALERDIRLASFDPHVELRIQTGYAFIRGLDSRRLEALRGCPLLEAPLLGPDGLRRLSEVDIARLEAPRAKRGAVVAITGGAWRGLRAVVLAASDTRVQVELELRSGRRLVWLTPAQLSIDSSN